MEEELEEEEETKVKEEEEDEQEVAEAEKAEDNTGEEVVSGDEKGRALGRVKWARASGARAYARMGYLCTCT